MRTTFFTCCNKKYEYFIPIFVHSILYHNDVDIEICVEDINSIDKGTTNIIEYIKSIYPKSVVKIRNGNFGFINIDNKKYKVIPNVVRFIETPTVKNDYVYICDIDIITLQKDIQQIHVNNMNLLNSNYSNIVRPHSTKLTGLHFSKWDSYYPIPDYSDIIKSGIFSLDEHFLYKIVEKKNTILVNATFRPVHGIHASENREDINTWEIKQWRNEWLIYRNTKEFQYIGKEINAPLKSIIKKIDKYYMEASLGIK